MSLLYTKMKIFHYMEKIDSLPTSVDNIMPPLHIRIKPTNVCNHNCSYCAYRAPNLQLGKDMVLRDYIPKEKMTEIIEDIIEMGVKAVIFSGGGEPFCYPFLLETVKKLSSSSVKFAALTNGSKLEGEIAEYFARYGTWLRISVDGWDNESYSSYRGVPLGEFTRVFKNIGNFKKMKGRCVLGGVVIVDKKNYTHLYDLVKGLKNAGVNSVKIAPCLISNKGKENNNYHKPIFKAVKELIAKAECDLQDKNFEIFDSYHDQLNTFKKDYTWCPYLQINPVIGADQNVYACHDKAYNLDNGLLGSISKERFKNFWLSDKSKFFRINPLKDCNHHCVVNEKNKLILEYLNADREHLEFV
ncbi:radical SAM protein [bacterium]|nr:radical SAM protein [bacterium]MBU3956626.1 radical SAM protein [bacterium]